MRKYNYARQKYIFKAKIICKPQMYSRYMIMCIKQLHVHFACHNYMQAIFYSRRTFYSSPKKIQYVM